MITFTITLKDNVTPTITDFDYEESEHLSEEDTGMTTVVLATMCVNKIVDTMLALEDGNEEGQKDFLRAMKEVADTAKKLDKEKENERV